MWHSGLNQNLLRNIFLTGSVLPQDVIERILACLVLDKFGVAMAVGDYRTPDIFTSKKLVEKATNVLTRKIRIDNNNEKLAATGASGSGHTFKQQGELGTKQTPNPQRSIRSAQSAEVAAWTPITGENLLMLKQGDFIENIMNVVTVSVVADVSVCSFVAKLQDFSMDSILEMRSTISKI